jgi:beta-glucanase (GH16 family)
MNCKKYSYGFIFSLCCVLALSTVCLAQKKKTGTKTKERIIFFDDFQGESLDRNNWSAEITGMHVNNELQAYVDTNLTTFLVSGASAEGAKNGALVIRPQWMPGFKTKDGQHFDFISGRINTKDKFEFTYGKAEARIKLTEGAGLWPAWWILGNGAWPACGEIDIMEYVGEADWTSAAVHGTGYSGETPFVNRQYFNKGNDVTQWHIYAVEWTPDALYFKYDGKLMFRINKKMTGYYGKWAFDNKKYLILNYALGGAYPVKVNGITTPYNGMPESTVDLIKKNKAKMLVDWIKVTQQR